MCLRNGYYTDKLSAFKLKRCYELAPPRIKQYLDAEIRYVLEKINPDDSVIELGCGYGRVLSALVQKTDHVIGIDTSLDSLLLAKGLIGPSQKCGLLRMDAAHLAFSDQMFDVVICIQNGLSAFHVDPKDIIKESIRVIKPKGIVLFSSYSEKIWNDRLHWFQLQSEAGFIGELDYTKTRNGVIVCKDGFTATTISKEQFRLLTKNFHVTTRIVEVDESSLFCEITLSS
jgi:2-polyprenyl-6-hydroxyphenyl methylase/3-demethylubiquinone-9 3-methyltransferase